MKASRLELLQIAHQRTRRQLRAQLEVASISPRYATVSPLVLKLDRIERWIERVKRAMREGNQ